MTGCPLLDSEYAARQNGKRLPCERMSEEIERLRTQVNQLEGQCYGMDGMSASAKIRTLQRMNDLLREENGRLQIESGKLRELVRGLVYATHPADRARLIADAAELSSGRMKVCVEGYPTPEQAVEATLGRGTCRALDGESSSGAPLQAGDYDEFWEPAGVCSECGELIPLRNYCPNCGREVVNDQ